MRKTRCLAPGLPLGDVMELKRLTDPSHPLFARAMEGYGVSFPRHEQRESGSQRAIMSHPEYHFDLILEGEEFTGCLLYWETEEFLYVEHFFILPERRNGGRGQRALELLAGKGKRVILEIDPVIDDISRRRKGFYERCGFVENPYPHVHPSYHEGNKGHDLVVMSCPEGLGVELYQSFYDYLCRTVMGRE